jgi:hypothetical protein
MYIPEDQLKTWSNQGGTANSITAHNSIRNALEANDSPLKGKGFEIFLQGSYRNSTNIRADSDVDVVVQSNDVFYSNVSRLPPDQKAAQQSIGAGSYNAPQWRVDVEKALRKKFGTALNAGSGKAFHVVTGPGNMTADVLPAIRFKNYTFFQSPNSEGYDEGLQFVDAAGNAVVNHPKLHIKNGEAKNSLLQTNGRYKPTVRIFKNARNYAIERNLLPKGIAPSYFVECLLFNVLDVHYRGAGLRETYFNIAKYLMENPIGAFMCQNGQLALFGTASTQWNTTDASVFIRGLANLWDRWE